MYIRTRFRIPLYSSRLQSEGVLTRALRFFSAFPPSPPVDAPTLHATRKISRVFYAYLLLLFFFSYFYFFLRGFLDVRAHYAYVYTVYTGHEICVVVFDILILRELTDFDVCVHVHVHQPFPKRLPPVPWVGTSIYTCSGDGECARPSIHIKILYIRVQYITGWNLRNRGNVSSPLKRLRYADVSVFIYMPRQT